MVLEFQTIF